MRNGRRRYRNVYRPHFRKRRASSVIKVAVGVVAVAALIFLGYCLFDPIMKFATGQFVPTTSSQPSSSFTPAVSSSKVTSSAVTSKGETLRGVYLPKSYLSETAALDTFITKAKADGINLAVIDLKGEDGIINYNTALEPAKGTEIVAKNAPDAAAAAKKLSAAGITPAARICAFKDPVAPTVLRGTGIMYGGNHTINWLDETNNRWLNPYSTDAQDYITSIADEALKLGYKQIFIDGLTFPTVGNPDKNGYYGDNMPSKDEVISTYVSGLRQKVNAAGGKLTVMTSGLQAIGQAKENVGQSADIFSFTADYLAPNLSPSLLGKANVAVGGEIIATPDLDPGKTMTSVAAYLKSKGGDKLGAAVPFIQAYTNSSLGSGSFKQYTNDDIKAEIKALKDAGINSFILYNPEGKYNLDVVKDIK